VEFGALYFQTGRTRFGSFGRQAKGTGSLELGVIIATQVGDETFAGPLYYDSTTEGKERKVAAKKKSAMADTKHTQSRDSGGIGDKNIGRNCAKGRAWRLQDT